MLSTQSFLELDIEKVRPDPEQPRKHFNQRDLEDLADSIKERGLMQPITVRKDGSGYLIVAGERRWRAHKIAGLKKIKAQVISATAREIRILSVLENIQRKDLNPIEESDAFKELLASEESDEALAKTLGKPLTYVRERLRLQTLGEAMREALIHGAITLPQALHLAKVSHANQMAAFNKVDKMNSKEWGRMVEAMAEIEQQTTMFEQPDPKAQEERRAVIKKYDSMIDRVESFVCRSFKRDEMAILSQVFDGDTGLRAERIDMIVKHLLLIRDALKRARATQTSIDLMAT